MPTYPALVTDTLGPFTAHTNSNDIRGGVEEGLQNLLQLDIPQRLREAVESDGGHDRTVVDNGAYLRIQR